MTHVEESGSAFIEKTTGFFGSELAFWTRLSEIEAGGHFLFRHFLSPQGPTLEGGTGGGRILFYLKSSGFTNLTGFDISQRLIESAEAKNLSREIEFSVQDAVSLNFKDAQFSQAIYVQQVLCFLPDDDARRKATLEAARVLKKGGRAIFSFLSFEGRSQPLLQRYFQRYLAFLRFLRGSSVSPQSLPWLKHGGRPNFGALLDRPPYVRWLKMTEISELLGSAGFSIRAAGCKISVDNGHLFPSIGDIPRDSLDGVLYVVCDRI
jgi:SAM-dependent methyltransferase